MSTLEECRSTIELREYKKKLILPFNKINFLDAKLCKFLFLYFKVLEPKPKRNQGLYFILF